MARISEFSFTPGELSIAWDDGGESRLLALWLRDHCQMPESRNPGNGQRLLNITQLSPRTEIAAVSRDGERLLVEFAPDGHRSEFDAGWLHANCYCTNRQHDDRSEAGKITWQAASFDNGPPRCGYDDFRARPAARRDALRAVRDYGFVLLDDVPCESQQLLEVIAAFGYVRETNYGRYFDVRTRVDANNLAYTSLGLGCHLDNPYRDPVPGLQLLHCLENSAAGGETILQDGFMAARVLRDEDAGHFELLHRHWIEFRFCDADADLRARGPLIEVDDLGRVIGLRFNNRSIDTIRLPPRLMPRFYAAYRHFAEILERASLQLVFRLRAGELMLFDNTRILHARKAYSAEGTRHLQGAYSDLDGLYSSLRKLEAQA